MSPREDSPDPGTSAASTSWVPQNGNRENPGCPVCQDIDTECSSSCRHCFCHLCLWDWSLSNAMCPQCQRPLRHTYPQHVALYHEVQDRVYSSKWRQHGRSKHRPWSCLGYSSQDGPPGRRRRRSMRWHHDGHWRSRHAHGRNFSRRRRQQWSRDWDNAPEEPQAPKSEWDIAGSSWGRQSRHRSHRTWSQDQQEQSEGHRSRQRSWSRDREHSHGWDRQLSRSQRRGQDTWPQSHGTEPHSHSARQRHWRSRNADEGQTPRTPAGHPGCPREEPVLAQDPEPCRAQDPITHPPKD